MEKIQFGEEEIYYPIISIQPVSTHILRIVFDNNVPGADTFGKPITIYSQGGIKECTLEGWDTIYYMDSENHVVYLSDDGSEYTEPSEPTPEPTPEEPEPYEPTVEELQTYKVSEMQSACESAIKSGIEVNGEHFTLDSEAQMALLVRQIEIITAVDYIDFYPDGEKSKYYTADEMQEIIDTANNFINGHEVYCNELCLWIKTLTDKDEIQAVYYGMEIPVTNRSEVLEKMLPVGDDETGMLPQEGKDDDDSDGDDTGDNENPSFGDDSSVDVGGNN